MDGRRGDGRNGEIPVGDDGAYALGQFDAADMDAVADVEPGQVGGEAFRNRFGAADEFDLVAHDVEDAAAFQAG